MTKLFGAWEVQPWIAILVYAILVILCLVAIGAVWYKYRKSLWAFFCSAALALLISAFLPLILSEIVFALTTLGWETVSPIGTTILMSLQGGTFALITRRILVVMFDISRLEIGKQN